VHFAYAKIKDRKPWLLKDVRTFKIPIWGYDHTVKTFTVIKPELCTAEGSETASHDDSGPQATEASDEDSNDRPSEIESDVDEIEDEDEDVQQPESNSDQVDYYILTLKGIVSMSAALNKILHEVVRRKNPATI